MPSTGRDRLITAGTFVLAFVVTATAPGFGDYPTDAGPALTAIAHGHFASFFAHQPAMGALSLFVRAPFAAIGVGLGNGPLGVYRWEALPSVLSVAVVAIWLGRMAERRGSGPLAPVIISLICLLNPLVRDALYWGHPEELLTAGLAVSALLAACDGRATLSAALAGLAVATKQWALLILPPCLLLLPERRLRALAIAAAVAIAVSIPMAIADLAAFRHALHYISTPQPIVTFFTWLYPLSPSGLVHITNIFGDARSLQGHQLLGFETGVRPLILVLGLIVPASVWWRNNRRPRAEQILIAAALVLVLRCALDPGSVGYYHLALLLVLVALDAIAGRRWPAAGLIGVAVSFTVLDRFPAYLPAGVANALYIAATFAGCALLISRLRASPRTLTAWRWRLVG